MIHLVQAREYVYMNKDLTAGGSDVNCHLSTVNSSFRDLK